jgi:hypothetical protein
MAFSFAVFCNIIALVMCQSPRVGPINVFTVSAVAGTRGLSPAEQNVLSSH